jgi:hypothetical protein
VVQRVSIRAHLAPLRRPTAASTPPIEAAINWAREWETSAEATYVACRPSRGPNDTPIRWKDLADDEVLRRWQAAWDAAPQHHVQPCVTPRPDHWATTRLPVHRGLSKAESAVLLQARTGHIGLQAYLHWRSVPTATTPECSCGLGLDNIPHWLQGCPARPRQPDGPSSFETAPGGSRPALENARLVLADTNHLDHVAANARMLLRLLPLQQFSWAREHQPVDPTATAPSPEYTYPDVASEGERE